MARVQSLEAKLSNARESATAGSGSAAYRQLASDIRAAIAAGRYPEGQRMPTEAEIVSATGLSRQTVRQAFQAFASEGAIYRIPGA